MSAPNLTPAVDNSRRRRRQVAVPQAAIARAARVAEALGRHWHVEIDHDVVRLKQGDAPMTQARAATPVAPEKRWRL
jgi:hypothetical protein